MHGVNKLKLGLCGLDDDRGPVMGCRRAGKVFCRIIDSHYGDDILQLEGMNGADSLVDEGSISAPLINAK